MNFLTEINKADDIPADFRGTPIEKLLAFHNFKEPHQDYQTAELLVGMCMDNRKKLDIPENFAFILRSGGANLRASEFKISFTIAIGGIQHIALIGHTQCGMVNLMARKEQFINGLCHSGGWKREAAERHFTGFAPLFEIGDEVDFIRSETKRLSLRYPKVKIAPLLYKVEDNRLYWINEKK